jgi:hypothetical protein
LFAVFVLALKRQAINDLSLWDNMIVPIAIVVVIGSYIADLFASS